MAKLAVQVFSLLFPLLLTVAAAVSAVRAPRRAGTTDFIKSSCGATRYPALCVDSLSVYAPAIKRSSRQLAQAALAVSLSSARSTAAFMTKMSNGSRMRARDRAALKDCVETMGDSVDRLSKSMKELGQVGSRGSFEWHMSNVETWVSAALTDENTCVDGFSGVNDNVKATVRAKIVNVAQITSNALALVNRFAQRRSAGSNP
ncbi:pectinesterase inhibitor 9-like [Aristolochia californica]|uniref:pectinesterase inhibitor 9-like n=1 Tax=Aristolochia californica TaxID=171875 RepID=UPI0035DD9FD5